MFHVEHLKDLKFFVPSGAQASRLFEECKGLVMCSRLGWYLRALIEEKTRGIREICSP
jgi:hypothetical protein